MTNKHKLPVSTRAILARINCGLRDQNRELRPTKGHKAREEFGPAHGMVGGVPRSDARPLPNLRGHRYSLTKPNA
jgi:hypothetical protein